MIAGRFEILGAGAQGAIKARDCETAQTVMLVKADSVDPRLVAIFHPALLSIFALVPHEGGLLAATEWVQAETLADFFRGGPGHPRRAAEIVSELADGVAQLHAAGVCHGAVGLRSAVLTAKGKAKLMLTTAKGGNEDTDVKSLKDLLTAIGGRPTPESNAAQTAAVLAACLRTPV